MTGLTGNSMQPDALCLNLKGFLSIFNLENSFVLHMLYFLITAFLWLALIAIASWAVFAVCAFIGTLRVKRGKQKGSIDV